MSKSNIIGISALIFVVASFFGILYWEKSKEANGEYAQEYINKDGQLYMPHNYELEVGTGKIVPKTKLNAEQLKIQEEKGCTACHEWK